jgi:hypothetical protein
MPIITAEPQIIYVEDVAYGGAVSEAQGTKFGSAINYLTERLIQLPFGLSGQTYQSLTLPYYPVGTLEVFPKNCTLSYVYVALEETGTSGTTSFDLQVAPANSNSFTTILSTQCSITSAAVDGVNFYSTGAAPSGVTLPVASTTTFTQGQKLRFVLTGAAVGGANLQIVVAFRPNN